MNYAVWNTLHDGSIDSAAGTIPGNVTVVVGIAYLCDMLPTAAKQLVVCLHGCSHFEYEPYDGALVMRLEDIGTADIEILSAGLEGDCVSICCVEGTLKLAYERAETRLVEGTIVPQEELQAAAKRYWREWSETNARK